MLIKKMVVLISVVALLALTYSTDSHARYTKRAGKWESTFNFINSQSTNANGEGGSSIELDSDIGWGFSLGYNVNPHILINYEFSSITPRYDATFVKDDGSPTSIKHEMNIYQSQFNVVYNLMAQNFTPFVQAGLGWSYLDSNKTNGSGGCYPDYYWGWYCYQDTYSDTRLSYNVAAGIRYELSNGMLFRASYKQSWVDLSHSDALELGTVNIEIGSIF